MLRVVFLRDEISEEVKDFCGDEGSSDVVALESPALAFTRVKPGLVSELVDEELTCF